MKRLFSILAIIALTIGFAVQSKAGERVDPSQVPAQLQAFVQNNFGKNVTIVAAERDREANGYEYDVMTSSGHKVEWGTNNDWIEVEGPDVPSSILGNAIATYVKNNYPQTQVAKIERERGGYEVDMHSGVELKFDKNFIFVSAKRR